MSANNYTVPMLGKAFKIIEKISQNPEGISFIGIVNSINEAKTTVFRILYTLEKNNWVEKRGENYYLGFMFIHYGLITLSKRNLRNIARPFMQKLTENITETSHIAVLSGKQSMLLDVCDSPHHIKPSSNIGALLPLHCTSHGKVFLSYAIKETAADFLKDENLEKKTKHTITNLTELQNEIGRIRSRGYAIDDLEFFEDVRCLAAPIWGADGACIGALGITATAVSFPRAKIKEYSQAVISVAKEISREMGGMS